MTGVFTIPPDVSFVEALATELWDESKGDPLRLSDMLILLPTRRACRHLREAFLRVTNGKAALLPRMQPLGDIDESELYFSGDTLDPATPPAITPLRRQMLLTRLIVQKDKTLPLDQAAQLASALASLLDQVQIERRDFADLENLVTGELAKHWQDTVEFLKIITAAWPKVLEEEGVIDPADRRNRILAAQAKAWSQSSPSYPVIAAGSTASIPAVADLMAVIAKMPQGRVILPGLDQQADEESWQAADENHPQYNMKNWLELTNLRRADVQPWPVIETERTIPPPVRRSLGEGGLRGGRVHLLQESMRPADTTQTWRNLKPSDIPLKATEGLARLELDNQQEEADVIALRLRAALEEENKTAALVTPDRTLAERVAAALRRWDINANDSAGAPLTSLAPGSFLRDVLAAASPEASAIDYLALLKHPLAACGLDPAECRHNARHIEKEIWRGISLSQGLQSAAHTLREQLSGKSTGIPSPLKDWLGRGESDWDEVLINWLSNLAKLFEPVTLTWPMPLPLNERIEQHIALAENIAATNDTPGARRLWRGEAGEAAANFFADWQQAANDLLPLTGDDYTQLFTELLRAVTVRPAYGQHPRLSILGPLEARLHHADLMILGGLNEGTWPPEPPIDPWLSRPMKKDFRLPLPERRIGLSAHDFVQLASAPEVLLTRARSKEGSPEVPSRFLLQIEAVLQALGYKNETNDPLAPKLPWREWARQLDTPEKIEPCAPPAPHPPVSARPTTLSVTEIGTWQRNPYAIYAKRILNLKKLEDIDADITAAERGTIIHEALEKFLTLHKTTWPADPLETLLSIGRDVFAPFKDRPQVAAFWWPRFERIAAWFIEREQNRRQAGIRVLAAECEGNIQLSNGKFTLKGRADRIDRLPDGTAAIIDYKTGTLPSQKEIDLGLEPQLPLLALIAEAGGFKDLGPLKTSELSHWQLKGANSDEKTQDVKGDLKAHINQARERLEKLIAEFAKPDTTYRAVPRPRFAPRYDDYAHLARLAEWSRTGGES
jgi:ATP-dependent helicase/nuclease subunit B